MLCLHMDLHFTTVTYTTNKLQYNYTSHIEFSSMFNVNLRLKGEDALICLELGLN